MAPEAAVLNWRQWTCAASWGSAGCHRSIISHHQWSADEGQHHAAVLCHIAQCRDSATSQVFVSHASLGSCFVDSHLTQHSTTPAEFSWLLQKQCNAVVRLKARGQGQGLANWSSRTRQGQGPANWSSRTRTRTRSCSLKIQRCLEDLKARPNEIKPDPVDQPERTAQLVQRFWGGVPSSPCQPVLKSSTLSSTADRISGRNVAPSYV